ncbi:SDR family NAD(P)-dependent oxidoreductase [Kineococcus sp. NBC_00420]|uniref:SDR family oxidoreductase n=1 Tax=unclassified Kineococcus TaxID=2621656 RepID=UPI002E22767F
MKITGRTVLITGGTAGIGLGLAQRLQGEGNTVVVAGRRTALLDQIVQDHPGLAAVELDVADPDSVRAAFDDVTTRFPDVDVLVNNAGIALYEDLRTGESLDAAIDVITTNLIGPLRMSSLFVPFFATRGGGTVVNVGSGLGFVPLPASPTYSATKAAIHSYSETQRVQLAGSGIDVVEIVPPAVRTEFGGQQDDDRAMPLPAFLDGVMAILREDPDVEQVVVDEAKPFRFAEAQGTYGRFLQVLAGFPVH